MNHRCSPTGTWKPATWRSISYACFNCCFCVFVNLQGRPGFYSQYAVLSAPNQIFAEPLTDGFCTYSQNSSNITELLTIRYRSIDRILLVTVNFPDCLASESAFINNLDSNLDKFNLKFSIFGSCRWFVFIFFKKSRQIDHFTVIAKLIIWKTI